MDKNKDNREQDQSRNQNGVVTVNDSNNPTPEERDARIGNEPDTERLRSERESVKNNEQGTRKEE
jgi:hypothetical protein